AGADDDAGAALLVFVLRRPVGVAHGLVAGGHGVEDEVVDPALLLGAHHLVGIEGAGHVRAAAAAAVHTRHLTSDLAGVVGGVEGRDPSGAGFTRQNTLPRGLRAPAKGRDHADSGDDDTTHG